MKPVKRLSELKNETKISYKGRLVQSTQNIYNVKESEVLVCVKYNNETKWGIFRKTDDSTIMLNESEFNFINK